MEKPSAYTIKYTGQSEIKAIIDLLGISTVDSDPQDRYQYDGTAIAVKNISVSAMLHEIAHWMLASEEERKLIDYGLGCGPNTGEKNHSAAMVAERAQIKTEFLVMSKENLHMTDDSYASLLGIAFEAALGYDINQTLKVHNWIPENDLFDKNFFLSINWLQNKKLLSKHVPAILTNGVK
jgi:hypothetical protein